MSTNLLPFSNYNVSWQNYDLCTTKWMFAENCENTLRPPSLTCIDGKISTKHLLWNSFSLSFCFSVYHLYFSVTWISIGDMHFNHIIIIINTQSDTNLRKETKFIVETWSVLRTHSQTIKTNWFIFHFM